MFSHQGRQLYHLAEIDYPTAYAQVREQVLFWQDQLGMPLYLENYPSILDGGHDAPAFFSNWPKTPAHACCLTLPMRYVPGATVACR